MSFKYQESVFFLTTLSSESINLRMFYCGLVKDTEIGDQIRYNVESFLNYRGLAHVGETTADVLHFSN